MALRDIVSVPNPVLRKKARRLSKISPDTQALMDDMVETMRVAPGVGLAAPQVGVSQRVIVVEYAPDEETRARVDDAPPPKPNLYVLANPEIVRKSRETVNGTEACLSVPGFNGDVERFREVTVEGMNRHGAIVRLRAKGWLARIFQHEIDHLDGVLFTDRASVVRAVSAEDFVDNV